VTSFFLGAWLQAQVDRIRLRAGLPAALPDSLQPAQRDARGPCERGQFDAAVHEYFKARSFSPARALNILKRVMAEVHKVVQEFREVRPETACATASYSLALGRRLSAPVRNSMALEGDCHLLSDTGNATVSKRVTLGMLLPAIFRCCT